MRIENNDNNNLGACMNHGDTCMFTHVLQAHVYDL